MKNEGGFESLKLLGFPLGRLLSRGIISVDSVSQQACVKLREISSNKGIMIFDAHPGMLDIFPAYRLALHDLDLGRVEGPFAAAFYFHKRFYNSFLLKVEEFVKLYPVFRKEELNYTERKFRNSSGLSKEEQKGLNGKYLNSVLKLKNVPGSALVIAPYGGLPVTRSCFRSGVIPLVEDGSPVVFSISRFDFFGMRYVTYLSEVESFAVDNASPDAVHEWMLSIYGELKERSGANDNLFEERKYSLLNKIIHYFANNVL